MYSSCCGVFTNADALDYQRCPECKESCDFTDGSENDSHLEYVTVKLPLFRFQCVVADLNWIANIDYTIKQVDPNDGKFDNDPSHQELKRLANKAYKDLKNYEYKVRNK